MSCKRERSLLSHEEHETVRVTHHPAIYEHDVEGLQAVRVRLRQLRDKERTLARQKQREVRGKAETRGGRTLPPGRLKLATRPSLTGSAAVVKTIGMVAVAALAASTVLVFPVAMITDT